MGLTHLDEHGNARMVEVGEKEVTRRSATAEGWVRIGPEAREQLERRVAGDGTALPGGSKKGDVLGVAQLAAIMGAKRTADLIPLCHPLPLDGVDVHLQLRDEGVRIEATARCTGRTGVEMEALTAVSVGALTVYDMLKAVDRGMRIEGVRLLEKTGGRSGHWRAT